MMGQSFNLDDIYYDKDNEKSQQKILLEYMKAIDALTITFTLYRAHSFLCLSIFRIFLSNQQTPFQQSLPYYIASKVYSYSGHYLFDRRNILLITCGYMFTVSILLARRTSWSIKRWRVVFEGMCLIVAAC